MEPARAKTFVTAAAVTVGDGSAASRAKAAARDATTGAAGCSTSSVTSGARLFTLNVMICDVSPPSLSATRARNDLAPDCVSGSVVYVVKEEFSTSQTPSSSRSNE